MSKYKRFVCLACAALILWFACFGCAESKAEQPPLKRFQGSFLDVFDTVTTVVLYESDKAAATARIQTIHEALLEYHRLFDIYHDYDGLHNIKTVNDAAGIAPVAVDARIIDFLQFSKKAYALTGGKVNIAMGSVLSIWHAYREAGVLSPENAELPPVELLQAASAHTAIEDVVVDEQAGTVYLRNAQMRLDVGALAKGYAAQRVAEQLRQDGAECLLLSVGGNVCAVGKRPDGERWRVGVQHPNMQDTLCTLFMEEESLVTSGTYQRYYTVNGARLHHIIDPETLMPAAYFDAVSILCHDSALADALSTALCNMPLAQGKALIEGMARTEALWVMRDGKTVMSSGFAHSIANESE